jgi:Mg-chelatase subunit ChlD
MWAVWRRLQYGTGYTLVLMGMSVLVYYQYFYQPPTCFDGLQNGDELGIDCDGSCVRICAAGVMPPTVRWTASFPSLPGQYNAVAYVENTNQGAGTPELNYTFELYDASGLIAERSGTTVLPPDSAYPVFEGRIDTKGRTPTETKLVLEPAELWLPYSFGRAQFRTTDMNLTGADDDPRLTVKVENTELDEAKEVEVVATIFDARGNPLTSSQTFVEIFPGRSARDLTFTWARPIAKTVRSCAIPTDVVVAIDLSGSMNNDGANPPQPITSVLSAAEAFVENLREDDQVSVVTFASDAKTVLPLTKDLSAAASLIKNLKIEPVEERGTTNTGAGLASAKTELTSPRHSKDARTVVVLLTDGLATAPGDTAAAEAFALGAASSTKAEDITVFTIGLGATVNMDFLRTIASTPGQAFAAPTTATLGSIYNTITASICEDGAARIEVIPKATNNFAPLE